MQPIVISAYASAYLIVTALGLHIIPKQTNEEDTTIVVDGNEQLLHRRFFNRAHSVTSQLNNDDDAIISEIQQMTTAAPASVAKGSHTRRIWPSGTRNENKTKYPRIRPAAVVPRVVRDFGEKDVVCYHGDLRKEHPNCMCCGRWEDGYMGETCATVTRIDCTEQYKKSHLRPLIKTAYY